MHVCIDLGTSNVRAGWMDHRGNAEGAFVDEPAVVAIPDAGPTVIGKEAEAMIGRHPDAIRLVRPVDGGVVRDFDAAVAVIRHVVRQLGADGIGRRLSVTLAVPSSQSQVDRKAMEEAARAAGAREVRFVESSIAAAIGARLPIDRPTGCLVVLMGGGLTEASLLSMGGIVDSRTVRSGGQAIDSEIVDLLRRQYSFLIGLPSAEQLKRAASQATPEAAFEVRGRNLETGLPGTLRVPRALVEQVIDAYTERIVQLIREAIEACPPELVGDILDHGVVLTGGGAHMDRVVSQLATQIEVPVTAADEPDTCVVRGLMHTRHPKARQGWKSNLTLNVPRMSLAPIRQLLRKSGTEE
ncbi:rod shape-determining protein [Alicyclobacillus macrosporangiidus]|uniref:Cell shape-determining protein MreB n=1 Tax=Alicyclobacillus macrosporangiidus TaxID=392015 RepID=A0A1I7KYG6_9BACL|nr:rod shape-determining protein [Alicyclobacillus macrosporangiidus]SFV02552.1 rod shape-determining protein MreB [Alicyclobacillus macrosporangiidus]